jgi:hypothetical protein
MQLIDRIKDALRHRSQAYRNVFISPPGEIVLQDLAKFCRAHETTEHPTHPERTHRLNGRREVWLHIQNELRLTDEQLWALYRPKGMEVAND